MTGVLVILLIGQQVYWGLITMQLTNKLMSRNYFEYAQVEKFREPPKAREESKEDDYLVDPEDERQAQALNSLVAF
jgi:hypothetical protein